jgi:tRNA threonylcarbamoyladenosine biosynthesis protein TsaE
MADMTLLSRNPEQTQLLGYWLGKLAQENDIFLLSGMLGTGKTCLVQGIAQGLNIKEKVTSPSFALVKEYYGRMPLYHVDLYRLDQIEEIIGLGLEEYFATGGVCAIEWAERGLNELPGENLSIDLSYSLDSETERSITFAPTGSRYTELIEQLKLNFKGEE